MSCSPWRGLSAVCASGRVWLYVLTPAVVSLLLAIGLAVWALGWLPSSR